MCCRDNQQRPICASSRSMQIRSLRVRREIRRRYTQLTGSELRTPRAYICRTESGRLDVPSVVRLLRGNGEELETVPRHESRGSSPRKTSGMLRLRGPRCFILQQCACSVAPSKCARANRTACPNNHEPYCACSIPRGAHCASGQLILRDQGGTLPDMLNLVRNPRCAADNVRNIWGR